MASGSPMAFLFLASLAEINFKKAMETNHSLFSFKEVKNDKAGDCGL